MRRILLALLVVTAFGPSVARAACTGPTGAEGQIIYSTTYHQPQYCNGTDWIGFGTINPAAGGGGCTSPAAVEGVVAYNGDYHVLQYCDGTNWMQVGSAGGGAGACPLGSVWTQTSLVGFDALASSPDGLKLVGGGSSNFNNNIFTSTNGGLTWTQRTSGPSGTHLSGVASSSDGTKLVTAQGSGYIYTSTDSGVTWTQHESSRGWGGVASSSDGTKLVAVVDGGYIYTSTDSGVSWTQRANSRSWKSVASSSDGTRLIAVAFGNNAYISTDSGVTWTAISGVAGYVTSVASSSDGSKLIVGSISGDPTYLSSDSGATWSNIGVFPAQHLAISDSGSVIAIASYGGQITISQDSGATFKARANGSQWIGIAVKEDGSKIYASSTYPDFFTITDTSCPTP